MEIFTLDVEGTNEEIVLSCETEVEIDKASEMLNETLTNVDLGIEPTLANIGGSYITSRSNAADYTEMYGWVFSKSVVVEM